MREYHRKSCAISKDVKDQVKAILKGYERLKRERIDILYGSHCGDGQPKGNGVGKPTEQKAVKLAYIDTRLEAIDQTAILFRGAYSDRVYEEFDPIKAYWDYNYFNYQHIRKAKNDTGPVYRTWLRYKDRFAECVANKLNIF